MQMHVRVYVCARACVRACGYVCMYHRVERVLRVVVEHEGAVSLLAGERGGQVPVCGWLKKKYIYICVCVCARKRCVRALCVCVRLCMCGVCCSYRVRLCVEEVIFSIPCFPEGT